MDFGRIHAFVKGESMSSDELEVEQIGSIKANVVPTESSSGDADVISRPLPHGMPRGANLFLTSNRIKTPLLVMGYV